ncbi:MAG: dUTP diphosphatase [Firmicutes bacterium]|nr:dUTP diphosphatase [Bacillota bacterium]
MTVKVKKLSPRVGSEFELPCYATPGSAGMDLCACLDQPVIIRSGKRAVIPTGLAFQLPEQVVGLIFSRSGHGRHHGVKLGNSVGVLDSDYIGEVQVVLENGGEEDFTVKPGDRIAQIVFMPVFSAQLLVVDELNQTERGAGGFGSTGVVGKKKSP